MGLRKYRPRPVPPGPGLLIDVRIFFPRDGADPHARARRVIRDIEERGNAEIVSLVFVERGKDHECERG